MCSYLLDACPNNFFRLGPLDSCYYVNTTLVNVNTAKEACRALHSNARLVAIETDAEFDALRRHYERLEINGSMYERAGNGLVHATLLLVHF